MDFKNVWIFFSKKESFFGGLINGMGLSGFFTWTGEGGRRVGWVGRMGEGYLQPALYMCQFRRWREGKLRSVINTNSRHSSRRPSVQEFPNWVWRVLPPDEVENVIFLLNRVYFCSFYLVLASGMSSGVLSSVFRSTTAYLRGIRSVFCRYLQPVLKAPAACFEDMWNTLRVPSKLKLTFKPSKFTFTLFTASINVLFVSYNGYFVIYAQ